MALHVIQILICFIQYSHVFFSVFTGQCLIGHLSQRTDWLHYLYRIITLASKGRIGQTEEGLGFFPSGPCWQMRWYHCTETGPTGDHGV